MPDRPNILAVEDLLRTQRGVGRLCFGPLDKVRTVRCFFSKTRKDAMTTEHALGQKSRREVV